MAPEVILFPGAWARSKTATWWWLKAFIARYKTSGQRWHYPSYEGRSLNEMSDAYADYIKANVPGKAKLVMIGYSMGGQVLRALHARHPHLASRTIQVILISCPGRHGITVPALAELIKRAPLSLACAVGGQIAFRSHEEAARVIFNGQLPPTDKTVRQLVAISQNWPEPMWPLGANLFLPGRRTNLPPIDRRIPVLRTWSETDPFQIGGREDKDETSECLMLRGDHSLIRFPENFPIPTRNKLREAIARKH
ncbi:MAG: alpha/beta hydrolase [Patescibacteria group bacterium]